VPECPEPHVTFVENCLAKARHASAHTGLPALADDSGICVEALNGAPGVYSARYAGEPKSDARNNEKLIAALQGQPNRRAHYYCVMVLVRYADDPEPLIAEGRWHLGRDVYTFVKLVPQVLYSRASLQDDSIAADLKQASWRFGGDGTLGGAWNIPRTLGAAESVPEVWLTGEFGYGWTMSKDTELQPDVDDSDPTSEVVVNMGSLALNGLMMRVSAAMTF